jgi:UDP-N-acetyl-D-glucosamine dehydrogenase
MEFSVQTKELFGSSELPVPVASEVITQQLARISDRTFVVGVVGLGYVGLPLIRTFAIADFPVVGFDIDAEKISTLNAGRSYIQHFSDADIATMVGNGRFAATNDFSRVKELDAVIICVPTPLTKYREPDVSYIVSTVESIAPHVRPGQLIVLESTTYPGTTREVVLPILEKTGLTVGRDIFLAFSPEREDPGNPHFETVTIPKIVGADDEFSRRLALALYGENIKTVVPVSSTAVAEAVKLSENIFRSVNIALVNELKVIYDRMGIDVWEVIEAAKTKPFGYMPFYPGPGLGGHCIPIDPFYLTWKAREYMLSTRFIELAGEVNTAMPEHVVNRLAQALDERFAKGLNGARILVLGAAYKKNIDDMRESPSLVIIDLLKARKAEVAYYDPLIPALPRTREHPHLTGLKSVEMSQQEFSTYDAVLISTDHDCVDYHKVAQWSRLVVDTRNAMKNITEYRDRIVKA